MPESHGLDFSVLSTNNFGTIRRCWPSFWLWRYKSSCKPYWTPWSSSWSTWPQSSPPSYADPPHRSYNTPNPNCPWTRSPRHTAGTRATDTKLDFRGRKQCCPFARCRCRGFGSCARGGSCSSLFSRCLRNLLLGLGLGMGEAEIFGGGVTEVFLSIFNSRSYKAQRKFHGYFYPNWWPNYPSPSYLNFT